MKYLMLVCVDPSLEVSSGQREKLERWLNETKETRLFGNQLRPQEEAKVVRVRGGSGSLSFHRGWRIVLEEAVQVASRHPVAEFGALDVRPFWPADDGS